MTIVANRDDILSYTRELWDQRDTLTRDDIDGGFYWKFCRTDFRESLAMLSGLSPDPELGATDENMQRLTSSAEWFAHWNLQNPSLLRDGSKSSTVPLRGAHFARRGGSLTGAPATNSALALVMSPDWRGPRVEGFIRGRVEELADEDTRLGRPEIARSQIGAWLVATSIRIAIVERGFPVDHLFFIDPVGVLNPNAESMSLPSPGLVIEVSLPLPPKGVIAAAYDQVAIGENMVDQIGPRGNGQTIEIAIRTWAIALLVAAGVTGATEYQNPKDIGIDLVSQELYGERPADVDPIKRGDYGEQFNELVRRVPESAGFLEAPRFRRKRWRP